MAVTTQRVLLILFLSVVLTHLIATFYYSPNNINEDTLAFELDRYDYIEEEFKSDKMGDGTLGNSVLGTLSTVYGNAIALGRMLWNFFVSLIMPFPIGVDDVNTSIEKGIIYIMNLYKYMVLIGITILEVYFIFFNKKNT